MYIYIYEVYDSLRFRVIPNGTAVQQYRISVAYAGQEPRASPLLYSPRQCALTKSMRALSSVSAGWCLGAAPTAKCLFGGRATMILDQHSTNARRRYARGAPLGDWLLLTVQNAESWCRAIHCCTQTAVQTRGGGAMAHVDTGRMLNVFIPDRGRCYDLYHMPPRLVKLLLLLRVKKVFCPSTLSIVPTSDLVQQSNSSTDLSTCTATRTRLLYTYMVSYSSIPGTR